MRVKFYLYKLNVLKKQYFDVVTNFKSILIRNAMQHLKPFEIESTLKTL